jgi:hypothetical protein
LGEGVTESGVQEFRSSGVQEFRSSGVRSSVEGGRRKKEEGNYQLPITNYPLPITHYPLPEITEGQVELLHLIDTGHHNHQYVDY